MEHTDRVTEIAIQDAEALDYEKKLQAASSTG